MTPDPQKRPTLLEIIASPFIDLGIVPPFIPLSAHDAPPDFRYITRPMSIINLTKVKKAALLDNDQLTGIDVPSAPQDNGQSDKTRTITSSIAQQEMEFQKAVQPGSPISALLSSARQPLVMSTANSAKESPLFRKLQAAKEAKASPLRNVRTATRGLQDIEEEEVEPLRGTREKNYDLQRQKELQSQKARIVAQMAPVGGLGARTDEEQENQPPVRKDAPGKERMREEHKVAPAVELRVESPPQPKLSGFDAAAQTLTLAFDAKAVGKLFRDPREDINLPNERVFIVSWVDYCNKYGMGYALTDGSVGVHFNDSTTLILAADKQFVFYYSLDAIHADRCALQPL